MKYRCFAIAQHDKTQRYLSFQAIARNLECSGMIINKDASASSALQATKAIVDPSLTRVPIEMKRLINTYIQ